MRKTRTDRWLFLLAMVASIVIIFIISFPVFADRYYHKPNITYLTPPAVTNEINVNLTDEQMAAIEAISSYSYTPDNCQGIAIAQAGANNTMYMGTKKPQLSLGVGECGGELASSLQFGMRVNNQLFLNGSWAADESVNGFGFGATVIFK